ncbi:MAG: hypothetical protein LBR73_08390 [Oscillospiraceae bacterium]|jgi:hypothetical protein|nr:hypothetical protein [Oscillospiraceae bacterium]
MEDHLKSQIKYALKYIPVNLAKAPFTKRSSPETRRIRESNGGKMMHGLCHASHVEDDKILTDIGVTWVRDGGVLPFDEDGTLREEYLRDKARAIQQKAAGIKRMWITPNPGWFLRIGIDPRTPEGLERVAEIARFLAEDLQGVADAFQIGNEMSIPRFAGGLTLQECCTFAGTIAKAMAPVKKEILVGFNLIGPQVDQVVLMRPYMEYIDYVGFDIYIGSFFKYVPYLAMHGLCAKFLWTFTKKPIILCEFGYLSAGQPKTEEEKTALLNSYGIKDENDLRENPDTFLQNLSAKTGNHVGENYVNRCASHGKGDYLLSMDFINHIYCQLGKGVQIKHCPHTGEGQAEFYRRLLPRLEKLPYLVGAFIYNYHDYGECCICGQSECPMETKWGICEQDNTPKPAYYAIGEIWNP